MEKIQSQEKKLREERKQVMEENKKAFEEILTPEQKEELKKMHDEHMQKMRERKDFKGPKPKPVQEPVKE